MSRTLRLLLLLALTALAMVVGAQDDAPKAKWTATIPADAKAGDKVIAILKAEVDEGWHVYSTKLVDGGPIPTTVEAVGPLKIDGKPESADVESAQDPNFGVQVEFITEKSEVRVPVILADPPTAGKLAVNFQACDNRRCMLPVTVEVPLTGEQATQVVTRKADTGSGGLLAFIGTAFLAGLLSLLTPCVFPMVPITVSYFAKRRESGGNGLVQALAYCIGIVGAFSAFGVLMAVVFKESSIQNFATNPWVNIGFAALFIFLALSLFGLVHLSLPSKVTNAFNPHGKAGLLGPVLMGLTFTLTSFTCTVPFVGTILVTAAQGGFAHAVLGMTAYGTAFALPFFFLALFPQFLAKMPRSGSWLEMVKAFMGFLELAAAVKFISNADLVWGTNLISRTTFLWIWAVIFAAAALFLLRVIRIPKVDVPEKIGRGRMVAIALTVLAAVTVGSGTTGRSLGELEAFLPPGSDAGWNEISYDRALAIARREKKPLLIDFTGVTCTNCRWMEKNMFTNPKVSQHFDKYVRMRAFTDRKSAGDIANQELMKKLTKSVALPIYVVVSPDEKVLRIFEGSTRDPEEFIDRLLLEQPRYTKR